MPQPVEKMPVKKIASGLQHDVVDTLATEEPLEIRLVYTEGTEERLKSISVTMRTPGHDAELATGFLFTEGIIRAEGDIQHIEHADALENVIKVKLQPSVSPDIKRLERNFYTTSSCGVCGKSSIESVRTVCNYTDGNTDIKSPAELIYGLPAILRSEQSMFDHTGGIHACALFDSGGKLCFVREDVGRHNALDKLIGAGLNARLIPLQDHILLLSGRASFELVQKAAMAGIKIVAAIGAPSTLAVTMAKEHNMTLIGFLRDERFNIYSAPERIII